MNTNPTTLILGLQLQIQSSDIMMTTLPVAVYLLSDPREYLRIGMLAKQILLDPQDS